MSDLQTATDHQGLLLDHLPPDLGTCRTVPRGAAVWMRNEPFDTIFFLRRGQVCITVEDERGHEVIARMVRAGEPFGMTCFAEHRRLAPVTSAVASTLSEIVAIGLDSFRSFLASRADLQAALLCTLGERLAYAEERIRILANHDAEDRVCALLEQVVHRLGYPSRRKSGFSAIQFTHAELAELAGLSRAHVSIVMGRLRDKGIVDYGRSTALLVNVAAIRDRRQPPDSACPPTEDV